MSRRVRNSSIGRFPQDDDTFNPDSMILAWWLLLGLRVSETKKSSFLSYRGYMVSWNKFTPNDRILKEGVVIPLIFPKVPQSSQTESLRFPRNTPSPWTINPTCKRNTSISRRKDEGEATPSTWAFSMLGTVDLWLAGTCFSQLILFANTP